MTFSQWRWSLEIWREKSSEKVAASWIYGRGWINDRGQSSHWNSHKNHSVNDRLLKNFHYFSIEIEIRGLADWLESLEDHVCKWEPWFLSGCLHWETFLFVYMTEQCVANCLSATGHQERRCYHIFFMMFSSYNLMDNYLQLS